MKFTNILTAGALATAMASTAVLADNVVLDNTTAPEQTKAIEKIVHDYLVNNPEVLLEASQALQQRQQLTQQKEARSAIIQNAGQLLGETLAVAGNPKGKVTLIEFFDYQCIHCKKMEPVINGLIKKNPDLRVVYKEFPIFGKSSELASKAALAAAMQGKYLQIQDKLLSADKHLDKKAVMDAAEAAGVNMTKLKVDMESKTVKDVLEANRKLAENMRLQGTPAFIVLSTPEGQFKADSEPAFVPGAATADALQAMIEKAAK